MSGLLTLAAVEKYSPEDRAKERSGAAGVAWAPDRVR